MAKAQDTNFSQSCVSKTTNPARRDQAAKQTTEPPGLLFRMGVTLSSVSVVPERSASPGERAHTRTRAHTH